jgi:uncharacterized protein (TIGR02453 family)
MSFDGFPRPALDFLAGLAENNDRAWFEDHRAEYEQSLLEPARDLVVALGEELDRRGMPVHADPRVNGSIFRINRDTRFSKDKRPYKTHLDLWLWQGEGPSRQCPGYFFRLTPQELLLGAGKHHFEPELLARYREAVADPDRGSALVDAVERVEAAGHQLGGRHYKRMPAGYEADGRRAELLLHAGLYAFAKIAPVPPEAHTPELPALCATRFAELAPVQEWTVELQARQPA